MEPHKALGPDKIMYTGLTKTIPIPFSKQTTEWQYVAGIIRIPIYEDGYKTSEITSIAVSAVYSNNINTAYFDGITLNKSSALTVEYDEDGEANSCIVDDKQYDIEKSNENGNEIEEYSLNGVLFKRETYHNDKLIKVEDGENNIIAEYSYSMLFQAYKIMQMINSLEVNYICLKILI